MQITTVAAKNQETLFIERKIADFCFFYIGLMTGLMIFRNVIHVLGLLYNLCVAYLAVRSIWICVQDKCLLTIWPFRFKILALCLSLTFSLCFSVEFFAKNLVALASQFLMCFIFLKIPSERETKSFIKGFKIVLAINYAFALLQLIIIKIYKVNIFYYLGFYLGLYDSASLAETSVSRITGLIWDPYVLGMFCAIGFFLFKKRWMKILIIVLLFFSYSRSGEVGFVAAFCYWIYPDLKKILKRQHLALPLMLLLFVPFLFLLPKALDKMDFSRGFSRESQGWRRIEYITKIPEVWAEDNNPFLAIFGGAPFYTGARYMFTSVDSMAKTDQQRLSGGDEEKAVCWVVETDWFGLLIGRGIFGLLAYLSLFFYIFKMNIARTNKAVAMAVFIAGVGYYFDSAIFACFMVYFAGSTKNLEKFL